MVDDVERDELDDIRHVVHQSATLFATRPRV